MFAKTVGIRLPEDSYDFLGRLMRVVDEAGSYYEYTYDANNQMTRLRHQPSGGSRYDAVYTYDKDGKETKTQTFSHGVPPPMSMMN